MEEVYIVTKKRLAKAMNHGGLVSLMYSTNEAVFASQGEAEEYIKRRKAAKDRDDRGCEFTAEPWCVM